MNTLTFVEGLLRDARHAVRMIRTKPGFSVAALLSLALGIGANTAIFSVLNAVLIRPLPYPGSDALVGVYNRLVIRGQVFEDAADPDFYSIVDADVLVNGVGLSEEGRGEALGDEHIGAIEEGVAAAAYHWEGEHDR